MQKRDKPTVSIIIPSVNEGKILTKVYNDCKKLQNFDLDIVIVISNMSSAATKNEAKNSGAKVLNIGDKLGKGTAVKYAIPHINSEYVVQIDADYQFLPEEIPQLISPLLNGYDVSLGTRYEKGSNLEMESVSYIRLSGSYLLSLITSVFAKQRITDVMAGFKAFKTRVLKDLDPQTNHFGYEAELVVRAAKRGYKIKNVPISYKKRIVGKSTVSSIKHGMLVFDTIINTAFEKGKNKK